MRYFLGIACSLPTPFEFIVCRTRKQFGNVGLAVAIYCQFSQYFPLLLLLLLKQMNSLFQCWLRISKMGKYYNRDNLWWPPWNKTITTQSSRTSILWFNSLAIYRKCSTRFTYSGFTITICLFFRVCFNELFAPRLVFLQINVKWICLQLSIISFACTHTSTSGSFSFVYKFEYQPLQNARIIKKEPPPVGVRVC